MRTYKMVKRSKVDYGCIVYGSAKGSLLKSIGTLANEAMRIPTAAFKSTPIESLQAWPRSLLCCIEERNYC